MSSELFDRYFGLPALVIEQQILHGKCCMLHGKDVNQINIKKKQLFLLFLFICNRLRGL